MAELPVSVFNQEMNCWTVNSSGRVDPELPPETVVAVAEGAAKVLVTRTSVVGVALNAGAEEAEAEETAGAEEATGVAELLGPLPDPEPEPEPEPPTVKSMHDS